MKKLLIVLIVIVFAVAAAACGSPAKEEPAVEEQPAAQATEQQPETAEEDPPEAEASDEPQQEEEPNEEAPQPKGTGSWMELFTEYQKRTTEDIEAFISGTDTAMLALKLMKGEIDLAFTASFFDPTAEDSVKMVFEMFGLQDVSYTEQGDTATAEGTDSEGVSTKFELRYDGGNTAVLYYYTDGELKTELSLCVTDDYAAKMYKSYEADNPETICAILKPNGDVWLGADTKVLDGTLYQNEAAAADPSFVTSLPEHSTFIGGVLTES
ncbi:hypothetical protein LJC56_11955 [Christensenellaceae bacterium OttesenSCG-928-K19]|nr:hypothetical protein [Christensenellaceae bacterium OttesenSCG-928-K19]